MKGEALQKLDPSLNCLKTAGEPRGPMVRSLRQACLDVSFDSITRFLMTDSIVRGNRICTATDELSSERDLN